MVNGKVWSVPAWMPTIARPCRRRAFCVVIVTFSVPVGLSCPPSRRGRVLGRDDREDDLLARLVLGDQLRDVVGLLDRRAVHRLDHVAGVQLALGGAALDDGRRRSPADCTGMSSSFRAATLALSWDWLNSSAFSWSACSRGLAARGRACRAARPCCRAPASRRPPRRGSCGSRRW